MSKQKMRVLVLGGGFAGMMAAVRLAGKARGQAAITLVNGSEVFVRRLRLHEYATEQPVPFKPIAAMLKGTGVEFVQGMARALDPAGHWVRVELADGTMRELAYDRLIYALGSYVDQDAVPGLREHAYVLNPAGGMAAPELKARLAELKNATARVLVVGGGATGIEAAAQIKGTNPGFRVELVTQGSFGAFKNERLRRHMLRAFEAQQIVIREQTAIKAVEADGVITARGEGIEADLVLWAGGFKAPALAREAGLAVNERDQVLTDSYQRATNQPDIFVVGDAAFPVEEPGAPYRMSVFVALVSGANVADNLARQLKGRTMQPLSYAYYGQAVTLGLKDAVGFATYPADAVIGPIYRGRVGLGLRNFFVWFLTFAIEMEKTLPGFLFWLGKGRYIAARRRTQGRVKQAST